jgi:hypothetical protein
MIGSDEDVQLPLKEYVSVPVSSDSEADLNIKRALNMKDGRRKANMLNTILNRYYRLACFN